MNFPKSTKRFQVPDMRNRVRPMSEPFPEVVVDLRHRMAAIFKINPALLGPLPSQYYHHVNVVDKSFEDKLRELDVRAITRPHLSDFEWELLSLEASTDGFSDG